MKDNLQSMSIAWIILLSLVLVWGSSFILIKRGLEVFSAEEVGALRISIAFLFLLPFTFNKFSRIPKKSWKYLIIVSIIGNAFPAFLFAKAQTGIDSNLAGILNSLTPLFTFLIAFIFFNFKVRWFNILGIFIGLAGAAGLINISGGKDFIHNINYSVYVIIAAICYATSVNFIKYLLKDIDIISITAFSFFFIGIPIVIYLLAGTSFLHKIHDHPHFWSGVGYITILSILGTALAMFAFNKVIKMTNPVFAASVTYMIPIIALMWGIIDGERFEFVYLLWIGLIMGGVYLVNRRFDVKN